MPVVILAAVLSLCVTFHAAAQTPSTPRFEFRNGFWLNLHLFVRGESRRRALNLPAGLPLMALAQADRLKWMSALDGYVDLATKNLLFNASLRRIANTLTGVDEGARLPDGLLDPAVAAALNAAAPVYREHMWPMHRRANAAWIEHAKALEATYGARVAGSLSAIYGVAWPASPILVDAVPESGQTSAYTHEGPDGFAAHTLADAGNRSNQGDAALELLFHEASHTAAIEDRIRALTAAASARANVTEPPNLWHALLFFNSCAAARRELPSLRQGTCLPDGMAKERAAFDRDGGDYTEGKRSIEQLLDAVIKSLRE